MLCDAIDFFLKAINVATRTVRTYVNTLQIHFWAPQTQFIHIAIMAKIWILEICKLPHMFENLHNNNQ